MWAFFVAAGVGILILAISLGLVLHFKCRDEDTIPASDKPNTGKDNITLKQKTGILDKNARRDFNK